MDRLTSLLTTCLLLALSSAADAQTLQLTVAGDVREPATLELQGPAATQPIHVRDLLDKAGIQGDGSAVVLRANSHQSGGSEFITSSMAGRGSQLSHGDIVVFHQTSGATVSDGHVVVIVDRTPRIVQLTTISGRLANLLGALNLTFHTADQIPVVRTQMGAPALRTVTPGEALAHGDVILLNQVARVDPEHVSRVFVHAASSAAVTAPPAAVHVAADQRVIDQPAGPVDRTSLTLPETAMADEEPAEEIATATPPLPAAETPLSEPTDSFLGMKEPAESAVPGMLPPAETADAVSPVWNGVFLCGLLGSITLILTGWLKTRRENRLMEERAAEAAAKLEVPREINPAPTMDTSWRTIHEVPSATFTAGDLTSDEISMPVADPSKLSKPSAVDEQTSERQAADRLVGEQEWLGGNWRQHDNSDVIPLEVVSDDATAVDTPAAKTVDVPSERGPETIPDTADSPVRAADVLEDLIRNRIPVELQQADLPLRVTLFGRPAGPRRLRIDAAHTQIAAPHFAAGARTRRGASSMAGVVSAVPPKNAEDTASLDRALNSLHEQDQG